MKNNTITDYIKKTTLHLRKRYLRTQNNSCYQKRMQQPKQNQAAQQKAFNKINKQNLNKTINTKTCEKKSTTIRTLPKQETPWTEKKLEKIGKLLKNYENSMQSLSKNLTTKKDLQTKLQIKNYHHLA